MLSHLIRLSKISNCNTYQHKVNYLSGSIEYENPLLQKDFNTN